MSLALSVPLHGAKDIRKNLPILQVGGSSIPLPHLLYLGQFYFIQRPSYEDQIKKKNPFRPKIRNLVVTDLSLNWLQLTISHSLNIIIAPEMINKLAPFIICNFLSMPKQNGKQTPFLWIREEILMVLLRLTFPCDPCCFLF